MEEKKAHSVCQRGRLERGTYHLLIESQYQHDTVFVFTSKLVDKGDCAITRPGMFGVSVEIE